MTPFACPSHIGRLSQVVKEDWEADSKGGKALSEADLSDSLWELTDLWVMTAAG